MTGEYAYFHARGASLAAVEDLEARKAQKEAIRRGLCEKYNALGVEIVSARFGSMLEGFLFPALGGLPDGWASLHTYRDHETGERIILAEPLADDIVEDITDRLREYDCIGRVASMEDALGYEEPPFSGLKTVRAADLCRAFAKASASSRENAGLLQDNVTPAPRKGQDAVTFRDGMDYMNLCGEWYIRVPNAAGSHPVFNPPDARPVPLAQMLRHDRAEAALRCAAHMRAPGKG